MRDLAGSCANIHARRCRPLRDPTRTHGCQRFSTGVGTDPTSKAIGCPDLGNDHLIVMTNLRARQPPLECRRIHFQAADTGAVTGTVARPGSLGAAVSLRDERPVNVGIQSGLH